MTSDGSWASYAMANKKRSTLLLCAAFEFNILQGCSMSAARRSDDNSNNSNSNNYYYYYFSYQSSVSSDSTNNNNNNNNSAKGFQLNVGGGGLCWPKQFQNYSSLFSI